jgi:hypothetical protein
LFSDFVVCGKKLGINQFTSIFVRRGGQMRGRIKSGLPLSLSFDLLFSKFRV